MATRRRFTGRRFRRKRRNLIWLPVNGIFVGQDNTSGTSNIPVTLTIPATGVPVTELTAATFDSSQNFDSPAGNVNNATNFGEILQGEYFLRRIVGNFFCSFGYQRDTDNDPSEIDAITVSAGIFIAREETASFNALDVPIGSTTQGEKFNNYGAHAFATQREPWIWRRQWILGNPAQRARKDVVAGTALANLDITAAQVGGLGSEYPSTNVHYAQGSNQQIDQKTLRRVRDDNRLFLSVSAWFYQTDQAFQTAGSTATLHAMWDIRLLGALRKARQTGSF